MASSSSSSASPNFWSEQKEEVKDFYFKTKMIQFFGRTIPIILQNDNGPCPLIAISNILSLRGSLDLSPHRFGLSKDKLLTILADKLLNPDSNTENNNDEHNGKQQQKIDVALNLLPRLATGINVNLRFDRCTIDDIEFTSECPIFDLLNIPLYHGWIVDPKDVETSKAIGSKCYNSLMTELVALETWESEGKGVDDSEDVGATTADLGVFLFPSLEGLEDDSVDDSEDIVGAATAALGVVPFTSLSEIKSSDDSTSLVSETILQLAEYRSTPAPLANANKGDMSVCSDESQTSSGTLIAPNDTVEDHLVIKNQNIIEGEEECSTSHLAVEKSSIPTLANDRARSEVLVDEEIHNLSKVMENSGEGSTSLPSDKSSAFTDETNHTCITRADGKVDRPSTGIHELTENVCPLHTSISGFYGSEPIYEGEECILDSGSRVFEGEPAYECETILAGRADRIAGDSCEAMIKCGLTPEQGEHVRNFLKNNSSQLTECGLENLQKDVKENELCAFFRNNHFSTMFKLNSQLYLLATDQGYYNQPDLVWEKLNKVDGDTLFMTGSFKEFKLHDDTQGTSDEQNTSLMTGRFNELKLHDDTQGTWDGTQGTSDGTQGTSDGTQGTSDDTQGTSDDTQGTSDGTQGTWDGTQGTWDGTQGTWDDTQGTWDDTQGTLNDTQGAWDDTQGTWDGTQGTWDGTQGTWDENTAAKAADSFAKIGSAAQAAMEMTPDLELAMALQQEEFEQEPPEDNIAQPSTASTSRLVTGSEVMQPSTDSNSRLVTGSEVMQPSTDSTSRLDSGPPLAIRNNRRSSSSSPSKKTEGKTNENCTFM